MLYLNDQLCSLCSVAFFESNFDSIVPRIKLKKKNVGCYALNCIVKKVDIERSNIFEYWISSRREGLFPCNVNVKFK